jgi:hypothetical protein
MLSDLDNFYLKQSKHVKSYLTYLRDFILSFDENITECWQYKMPFFKYKNQRICYLWINKKNQKPYLGIVDGNKINHPLLISENRSRMKIILFDPKKKIPVKIIKNILQQAIEACK